MSEIDEEISYAREVCENCRKEYEKYAKFIPQAGEHFLRTSELYGYIAEILKELKELREKAECARCVYNCGCIDEIAYKDGYNKAIDDFVNGIKEILEDNSIYNMDCIYTLAEQLKVGGENENK